MLEADQPWPWPWRYGVAALCVAAAVASRMALAPILGERQPFPTFYVALILVASFGGRGPVLFSLVLGYLAADRFFVPPHFANAPEDAVAAAAYFLVGVAIAAYSDVMRSARERARACAAEAMRKQAELERQIAGRERVEREREALLGELETARARLEAVLRQMPAGVIIAEAPSGRFVLANDQVPQIWRQPFIAAEDFRGYRDFRGFDRDGRPYEIERWPLARSLTSGEVVKDEEIDFLRGDGTRGTMCVSSAPIRDAAGAVVAAVVVFYDSSSRRRAEEELRRAREQLELRVAERTAALAEANAALRSEVLERRMAERARNHLLRRLVRVQEEERGRIARELHDQMGQQLTALKLGLEAIRDGMPAADAGRERLEGLLELTRRLGHDMHRVAWELGPSALEGYDLPTALASYAEEWSGHTRVPVQFHCSGAWDDRPSPQAEATVYRVVQEALTNVAKHALARRVSLLIDRRDGQLHAIVEDDGAGFNPEAANRPPRPGRGLGLIGMRERVQAAFGSLEVESSPGRGTTVFVRVPAADEAEGHDDD